jgi:SAM-dependent methyltransferase
MPTWLVIIFTIMGTTAILKLLHAFAIVAVHPVTQGAMYTSTARVTIRKALDAVSLRPGEFFIDLGCGDGRVLREARKRYRSVCQGFEVNPIAFLIAKLLTFWRKGVKVSYRNFWRVDLKKADVVACYLFPDVMRRLGKKLAGELLPGARVISFNFPIPGWKPQSVLRVDSRLHNDPIYIYRIPESLPDGGKNVTYNN